MLVVLVLKDVRTRSFWCMINGQTFCLKCKRYQTEARGRIARKWSNRTVGKASFLDTTLKKRSNPVCFRNWGGALSLCTLDWLDHTLKFILQGLCALTSAPGLMHCFSEKYTNRIGGPAKVIMLSLIAWCDRASHAELPEWLIPSDFLSDPLSTKIHFGLNKCIQIWCMGSGLFD